MQGKHLGFTLIEILAVLLLISVLALIAYPNYISYIYKSNRLDAKNSLFHYQALWQQCLVNEINSDICLETVGLAPEQTQTSLAQHYHISARHDEFIVTFKATPLQNQINDNSCASFLLDSQGGMKAYDDTHQETTASCW